MFLKLLHINIYTFVHLGYVVYNYIVRDWTTYTSLIPFSSLDKSKDDNFIDFFFPRSLLRTI